MYIGPRTEDPPIPSPPMKRNATSEGQFHAAAQPRAETKYKMAMSRRLSRRPSLSPGNPASIDPMTVPQRALATVMPNIPGESWKVCLRAPVVPEMTAVSKPNRRPPSAATTVLFTRYAFSFMPAPDNQVCTQWKIKKKKRAVDELYPRLSTQRQRPAERAPTKLQVRIRFEVAL